MPDPSILPPLMRDLLSRYAHDVRARFGARVHDVRAFGSYARGEANEQSDLDVFVAIEGLTATDKREAIDIATGIEADYQFRLRISPLVMDRALRDEWRREERRLMMDVDREGIPA